MRQFFTWRFWLSIVALLSLTGLLVAVTRDDDQLPDAVTAQALVASAPEPRRIDLIALVFQAQADPGFAIVRGRTNGNLQIQIDGTRFMKIGPGTPGENRCNELAQLARCVVVADLLGESVLWFSIIPAQPRNNLAILPEITELRDGNLALLANGWIVKRSENVTRECEQDSRSLSDFVNRYGDGSSTTFSIDEQQIIRVTCAGETTDTSDDTIGGEPIDSTPATTVDPALPGETTVAPIVDPAATVAP